MTNIITDLKKCLIPQETKIFFVHTPLESCNLILHLSVLNDIWISKYSWIFIEVSCNSELIRKIIFWHQDTIKLSLLEFLQFPNVSLFTVMLKIAGVQAVSSWIHSLRSSYSDDQYQTKNYDHHQVHRDDDCFESGALKKRKQNLVTVQSITHKNWWNILYFFSMLKKSENSRVSLDRILSTISL